MSRKSYQKVTLSVELTLPPKARAKDVDGLIKSALEQYKNTFVSEDPLFGLNLNLAVIKIIKRETIYTN